MDKEREQIAALVNQERTAIMADAQRFTDHATAEATRQAKEVVDHAMVRLAVVLGALLVLGAALAWIVLRRARPARPPSG